MIGQRLQEAVVLLEEGVVDDLPPMAERVCAGIHQRLVLQVLVLMPFDRIDGEERADDRAAALGDKLIGVLQELPSRLQVAVEDAVRPERGVVARGDREAACVTDSKNARSFMRKAILSRLSASTFSRFR